MVRVSLSQRTNSSKVAVSSPAISSATRTLIPKRKGNKAPLARVSAVAEERISGASPSSTLTTRFDKSEGKTVVITGSSQGIGRATALRFAKDGYNVVIVARPSTFLEKSERDVRDLQAAYRTFRDCVAVPCDITNEDDVQRLVQTVQNRFDTVDVVVSNAGICMAGPLEDTSMEDFHQQMNVNFFGAVSISKAFIASLMHAVEKRGSSTLAFVNSFGGKMPLRNMPAYTASKFALAGYVDSIRPELGDAGIRVVQIHPGVVKSDFLKRAQWRGELADQSRARLEGMLNGQGGSGMLVQTPEEVAEEVWQSVSKGREEVFVGAFKGIWAGYKTLGINPFLLGPPSSKKVPATASM